MKKVIFLIFGFIPIFTFAQTVQYKYDNLNRLKQVLYSDQKSILYSYDKNGNRIYQITSTIVTAVDNLNDSLIQTNSNVFIYPNPSNGDFKTRVLVSKKQKIIVQLFTLEGKLIHEYSVDVLKGYYDININITPQPTGTYIIKVKGKTINSSKKVIILK